jgi:hypothetical protein
MKDAGNTSTTSKITLSNKSKPYSEAFVSIQMEKVETKNSQKDFSHKIIFFFRIQVET